MLEMSNQAHAPGLAFEAWEASLEYAGGEAPSPEGTRKNDKNGGRETRNRAL